MLSAETYIHTNKDMMSSSIPQSILNQNLFEVDDDDDHNHQAMLLSSQVGILPNFLTNLMSFPLGCNTQSNTATTQMMSEIPFMKTLVTVPPPPPQSLLLSAAESPLMADLSVPPKLISHDDFTPLLGATGSHLLSLQRSSPSYWSWGELGDCMSMKRNGGGDDHRLGVSAVKMKKIKSRKKVREPRFCFKTMSDVDVLDDGYKWRKYGQKVVKNTQHPRSYYRCTQDNCRVKKRVERLAEDPRMVITTYEGRHIHDPCQDEENVDSDQPNYAQLNNFFSL